MTERAQIVERLNQLSDSLGRMGVTDDDLYVRVLRDAAALIGGTCATCKHWDRVTIPSISGKRFCGLMGPSITVAETFTSAGSMLTSDDFGCNLWTPADPTPRTER